MTNASPAPTGASDPLFDALESTAASAGIRAMFALLAERLAAQQRWHALFDARLLEARATLGLPLTGELVIEPEATPATPASPAPLASPGSEVDARSLAACREVGWPLVEEGQVAAGWMYLRAAVTPAEMAERLAGLVARLPAQEMGAADNPAEETAQEIIHVALWEGVDPALGLSLLLARNGTCNAITAYEQAVSRLPARRQEPAARLLVNHLYSEIRANLAHDLASRGRLATAENGTGIAGLLDAAGGLTDDGSIHVDVSHLQSVLRLARVCTDRETLQQAWELARYGCRLPPEVVYPGEPPFENVAEASRHFFGAQLGHDVPQAVAYFRKAAVLAKVEEAGTLPSDTLMLLLWRLGRPQEALHAALQRPHAEGMPSAPQAIGMLPSLVELASAAGDFQALRTACRQHGDTTTFAATLVAEQRAASKRVI
jgi:hypothetical protein